MERWESRYVADDAPWDSGIVCSDLRDVVTRGVASTGRALELGCGTGTNAVWLAQRGFAVVAVDISPTAIARARERAAAVGVAVDFRVGDVLVAPPGDGFEFVFDRGVLHVMEGVQRSAFARTVRGALAPTGLWMSMLGSADETSDEPGPPRWTAVEVTTVVEPMFRIDSLVATKFEGIRLGHAPMAWRLLARPR